MSESAGIDKQALYGDFRDDQKRKADLAMKAAHKALDIADDPVKVEANKTYHGVGGKGVALAALAGGLPTAAIAAVMLLRPGAAPEPQQQPAAVQPALKQPVATPAKAAAWDAIYEERQPDGTWKQVRRERLTPKE